MSKPTYRKFDPWRAAPVIEESRESVVDGHYFNVDLVSYHSPDIGNFQRNLLHAKNGDSVGVLGLTDEGLIPLVEQYRLPVHRWTLEIPAGHSYTGKEGPLQVAKERLLEEAGFEAKSFQQFCRFINSPSFSTQYTTLFLARGLKAVQLDETRVHMSVRFVEPGEALEMVNDGMIIDAKTIIAVQTVMTRPDLLQ
ncbi:ADP-ribose pyrophosphatase [Bifidobacterium dolichotidis]|uniref:ADP-ribose pyrophosphatase n=1 Tax=Bifidobacterium dolichotidis TaxID=2306976 RepID=A0A430FSV0_9BIFI|nr:NUDIX hydrolase [Bifidobacterium dolichotidis]RSX55897.1 ADP-ribose pyrophosphatase [Bifidobacterium dolichotidis]